MNIFGFRPFKGKFNLGDSDDIPTNEDGTLIGSVKQIKSDLSAIPIIKSVKRNTTIAADGTGSIDVNKDWKVISVTPDNSVRGMQGIRFFASPDYYDNTKWKITDCNFQGITVYVCVFYLE